MKKLGSLLLIVALLVSAIPQAFATIEEKEQELESINSQIDQKQEEIDVAAGEVALTQASIEEVMANQQRLEAQIEQTDKDIAAKKVELEKIAAELKVAIAEVEKQQEEYGGRLRVIYLNQDNENALSLLLKSKSIEDFLMKLQFMKSIVDEDKKVLGELNEKQQKVEALEKVEEANLLELNKLQEQLELDKQELVLVKKVLEDRKAELEARKQQLIDEAAALAATSESIRGSIETMRAEALRIAAEQEAARLAALQAQQNQGGSEEGVSRGDFSLGDIAPSGFVWPSPGVYTITSPFDMRSDPIMGHQAFHQGVDIAGPVGSSIVAAASGIVISAGWMGSYGNCVIISHPNGYETVYAHGSSVNVSVGQVVNQGDVVMYMGSTGYSTGSHLHFEVISSGSLIDPLTVVAP